MKTRTKNLLLCNILTAILFLLPVFRLDLFKENYSTLSLNAEGHLFLLGLGILTGSLMGYETVCIANKKRGYIVFASLLLGTLIPHHVPYDFQGNMHLFFAYTGFFVLIVMTYLNTLCSRKTTCRNILILSLTAAFALYLRFGMVNTLAEIVIMFACMGIDLLICIEKRI